MDKKINTELIEQFKNETGGDAIYNKNGATFHTLDYVNWLEKQREKEKPKPCVWKWSQLGLAWSVGCRPRTENGRAKFCLYCGGEIVENENKGKVEQINEKE